MEFILRQQAKAEGQMAAIRKLIQVGMRMIVKNEALVKQVVAAQKVTEAKMRDLAAAQKVTEGKLQGFIDALRRGNGRGGNGRRSKN